MVKRSFHTNWLQLTVVQFSRTPGFFLSELVYGYFHKTSSTYVRHQFFKIWWLFRTWPKQTNAAIFWVKGTRSRSKLALWRTGNDLIHSNMQLYNQFWWRHASTDSPSNLRGHCYNENILVKQAELEEIHISKWGVMMRGCIQDGSKKIEPIPASYLIEGDFWGEI